jgi:hypothetical protein
MAKGPRAALMGRIAIPEATVTDPAVLLDENAIRLVVAEQRNFLLPGDITLETELNDQGFWIVTIWEDPDKDG